MYPKPFQRYSLQGDYELGTSEGLVDLSSRRELLSGLDALALPDYICAFLRLSEPQQVPHATAHQRLMEFITPLQWLLLVSIRRVLYI
jgi:hypothetical protein